ncbi:MAG: DUF47 family protein [Eggerthellaceae bacterium]|nr:DUF47 family protein [Eggerthellaceae bacterium]
MAKSSKRLDYFDAFKKQADLIVEEAKILIEAIEGFTNCEDHAAVMKRAHDIENQADEICHSLFTAIATDFITPIEREDIISLALFLDDIIDYIEDVIQRFYMYDVDSMHPKAIEFARLIEAGSYAVEGAMEDFRNFKKSKNFSKSIVDINSLEEEADDLYISIIRDLHVNDKDDPLKILVWSQIFGLMEKCTDAYEHAADTMRAVMLKNS